MGKRARVERAFLRCEGRQKKGPPQKHSCNIRSDAWIGALQALGVSTSCALSGVLG